MRYSDVKKRAVSVLKAAGIEEAEVDAEYLLLTAAGLERSSLFVKLFEEMPESEEKTFNELLARRSSHEPLQYIIGSTEFMGYKFIVTPDVLIPRFDTEILAELAVKRSLESIRTFSAPAVKEPDADMENNSLRILDLCTGSGCVAVSVGLGVSRELTEKCMSPVKISVTGADISRAALDVAGRNLELNEKESIRLEKEKEITEKAGLKPDIAEIKFIESDLFNAIEGKYHIITANPPYIVRDEIQELMPEITEHEPHLALDGGSDGMDFYRRIVKEATGYLYKGGRLLMEFDDSQAGSVKEMMQATGFSEIEIHKDLAGLKRVIEGVLR